MGRILIFVKAGVDLQSGAGGGRRDQVDDRLTRTQISHRLQHNRHAQQIQQALNALASPAEGPAPRSQRPARPPSFGPPGATIMPVAAAHSFSRSFVRLPAIPTDHAAAMPTHATLNRRPVSAAQICPSAKRVSGPARMRVRGRGPCWLFTIRPRSAILPLLCWPARNSANGSHQDGYRIAMPERQTTIQAVDGRP